MNSRIKGLYEFGSFQMDPEEHVLLHDGQIVHLTPKAFDILLLLIENKGHVVGKDELLDEVWPDTIVEEANVAKSVSLLRKALSEDGLGNPFIETIPTRGYRFIAPVRELDFEVAKETEQFSKTSSLRPLTKRLGMALLILPFVGLAAGIWSYWPYQSALTGDDGRPSRPVQMSLLTENGKTHVGTVSPDGKSVVLVSRQEGGKHRLLLKRIATGATQEIVAPTGQRIFFKPAFSPDGEFIYYSLGRTLYRASVLGEQKTPLLVDNIESSIAVSPDSERLAFISYDPAEGSDTIVISDKNGKNITELIKSKEIGVERFGFVLWSDDGHSLLFRGDKKINIDDGSITESKLFQPLKEQGWKFIKGKSHILMKDGTGLFFVGKKNAGDKFQINHLSFADGKISPVTNDTSDYHSFSMSDDGKTFVAVKIDEISNLASYDPATEEIKTILENNKSFVLNRGFSQTPDGKILFSMITGKNKDLFSMNEDGTNKIQLTSNNEFNYDPLATPDGNYIIFRSNRGGTWNIWRMNTDGSDPVQITKNTDDSRYREVQLANHGKTIIFVRHQNNNVDKSSLMKVSIDGGEAVPLLPESRTIDSNPRISPDGTKLVYRAFDPDPQTKKSKWTIHLVFLDEDKVVGTKVLNPFAVGGYFDWTRDSNSLTFMLERGQIQNLWNLGIYDGQETSPISLKANNVAMFQWASDGQKIFFVRKVENRDLVLIRSAGTSAD